MRKLLFFIVFYLTSHSSNAQFFESFEGASFPPTGWLVTQGPTSPSQAQEWNRTNFDPLSGSFAAYIHGHRNIIMGNTSDEWLVTPSILIADNLNYLSFYLKKRIFGSWNTTLEIKISTQANQSDLSSFTTIATYDDINDLNNENFNEYKKFIIDLTSYENTNIFIAFVFKVHQPGSGLTGNNLLLDDVKIERFNMQLIAFLDLNNNSLKDNDENYFSEGSFVYDINNSGSYTYVQSNEGIHTIYDTNTLNSYNFSFEPFADYNSNIASSTVHSNIFPSISGGFINYYFPLTVTNPFEDLSVNLSPFKNPVPGQYYRNIIQLKNLGTLPASGSITFVKDPIVTLLTNYTTNNLTYNPTGFTYTFTNLQPNSISRIGAHMEIPLIPTVSLGDFITNTVSLINNSGNDLNLNNNNATVTQEIVASFDPNDKTESHGNKILITEFDSNDYLSYTIRFENIGTAIANFVQIEDLLDSKLDESTFQMLDASHDYKVSRVNNQLIWSFENIVLLPTSEDTELSNGYLHFKIKPKAGFVVGTIIPNSAEIYFDTNPAIITNIVNTEFVANLNIIDIVNTDTSIFPNPANENVIIQLSNTSETLSKVVIYDVLGKTISLKENLTESSLNYNISNLTKGIYFVEINISNNQKVIKKLVKQ